jgi:hypothetical protein
MPDEIFTAMKIHVVVVWIMTSHREANAASMFRVKVGSIMGLRDVGILPHHYTVL